MKSINDLFEYIFNEYQLDPKLNELVARAKADFDAFMKGEVPPTEIEAITKLVQQDHDLPHNNIDPHSDFKRYDT